MEEFLDYLEEVNRFNNGLPPKGKERLRPPPSSSARGEYRQVGLKLALDDYQRLAKVAKAHGVSPSTLARILVVRNVRAGDSAPED